MAAQPMGESTNQQQWADTFRKLFSLSDAAYKRNAYLEQRVLELEMDLSMWKHIHSVALESHSAALKSAERDVKAHRTLVSTLNRQMFDQDLFAKQSPLILCVVDGNENLFQRFADGHQGGRLAAQDLTRQIAMYLNAEGVEGFKHISFWITVYFNRGELLEKLILNNICTAQQFDAFVAGFSQQSPRFSLVDVGDLGGADTKIKEYIDIYIRFPQTLRLFLVGGHGPQYTSLYDALEAGNVLGKLVMVGVNEVSDRDPLGIGLSTDGIFMTRQLLQRPTSLNIHYINTNGGLLSPQSPASLAGGRTIDPSLPLHKQDPPPCNEHYLMTCSKEAAQCKYSHEYILTQDQVASLAANAKKAPCNWLKNGRQCPQGDKCCWGHYCPNGPTCFHLSKGKCWFKGEAMHLPLSPSI